MSQEEQDGYLAGLADMQLYVLSTSGHEEKAACIQRQLFEDPSGEAADKLAAAFVAFPDRPAAVVFAVIMDRYCDSQ